MGEDRRRIVVGVTHRRAREVVAVAAWYAEQLDADLVCAIVDTSFSRMAVPEKTGIVPVPEAEGRPRGFPDRLTLEIREELEPRGIAWEGRLLFGGAAAELTSLAEEVDAVMIVVGTREGMGGFARELLNGSVAAHLSHRQRRPVLVVPLDPVLRSPLRDAVDEVRHRSASPQGGGADRPGPVEIIEQGLEERIRRPR